MAAIQDVLDSFSMFTGHSRATRETLRMTPKRWSVDDRSYTGKPTCTAKTTPNDLPVSSVGLKPSQNGGSWLPWHWVYQIHKDTDVMMLSGRTGIWPDDSSTDSSKSPMGVVSSYRIWQWEEKRCLPGKIAGCRSLIHVFIDGRPPKSRD